MHMFWCLFTRHEQRNLLKFLETTSMVEHFIPLDVVHLTCQEVGSIGSCRVQAAQGLLPMGIKTEVVRKRR